MMEKQEDRLFFQNLINLSRMEFYPNRYDVTIETLHVGLKINLSRRNTVQVLINSSGGMV